VKERRRETNPPPRSRAGHFNPGADLRSPEGLPGVAAAEEEFHPARLPPARVLPAAAPWREGHPPVLDREGVVALRRRLINARHSVCRRGKERGGDAAKACPLSMFGCVVSARRTCRRRPSRPNHRHFGRPHRRSRRYGLRLRRNRPSRRRSVRRLPSRRSRRLTDRRRRPNLLLCLCSWVFSCLCGRARFDAHRSYVSRVMRRAS
jgi:hypothetical protein